MKVHKILLLILVINLIFINETFSQNSNDQNNNSSLNHEANIDQQDSVGNFNNSFLLAGVTLGTPGLINVNMGSYGERLGFQASISFLNVIDAMLSNENDDTYNEKKEEDDISIALLQINFNVKLYSTENFLLAFSIAGGTYYFDDEKNPEDDMSIFYVGPCIHIYYHRLFLELGVAYGKDFEIKYENESTSLLPLIQIGYIAIF